MLRPDSEVANPGLTGWCIPAVSRATSLPDIRPTSSMPKAHISVINVCVSKFSNHLPFTLEIRGCSILAFILAFLDDKLQAGYQYQWIELHAGRWRITFGRNPTSYYGKQLHQRCPLYLLVVSHRLKHSSTVHAANYICAQDLVLTLALFTGVHFALYCICAYTLVKRKKKAQLFMLLAVTAMFILSTADIALSFRLVLRDIPALARQKIDFVKVITRTYPKTPLFVANK